MELDIKIPMLFLISVSSSLLTLTYLYCDVTHVRILTRTAHHIPNMIHIYIRISHSFAHTKRFTLVQTTSEIIYCGAVCRVNTALVERAHGSRRILVVEQQQQLANGLDLNERHSVRSGALNRMVVLGGDNISIKSSVYCVVY